MWRLTGEALTALGSATDGDAAAVNGLTEASVRHASSVRWRSRMTVARHAAQASRQDEILRSVECDEEPVRASDLPRRTADVVRLRLPAIGAYLSVLRSATAGLAARLDFTLEEIEDLRIAVDEACAILLPDAGAGRRPRVRVRAAPGRDPGVRSRAPTLDGAQPARDTFAWTVLAALAG